METTTSGEKFFVLSLYEDGYQLKRAHGYGFLWSTGATSDNIKVRFTGSDTSYSVIITEPTGTMFSISSDCFLNMSVEPNEVCSGQQAIFKITDPYGNQLQPGMGYYVEWSTGETGEIFSVTKHPTAITTVSVLVFYQNQCQTLMDRTVIVVPSPPIYWAPVSSEICEGESVELSLVDQYGQPLPYGSGWAYQWESGATAPQLVVSPSQTKTYRVTITSPDGCVKVMEKTIKVNSNPPVLQITQENLVNNDRAVLVSDTFGVWSTGQSGECIVVDELGLYSITVEDQHGCTSTGFKNVTELGGCKPEIDTVFYPEFITDTLYWVIYDTLYQDCDTTGCSNLPEIDFASAQTICLGDYPNLYAYVSDMSQVDQILWSPIGGVKYQNGQVYVLYSQHDEVFVVKVEFNNGCSVIKHIPVTVENCTNVQDLEWEKEFKDNRIFNLLGQEIFGPIPLGTVYFRRGGKLQVRFLED